MKKVVILLVLALGVSSWSFGDLWAQPSTQKAHGEIDPESALLYAIRPKGPRGGNGVEMDLFADTHYLLQLRGNAYGFVRVEPGVHWIWGAGDIERIEFVAGETFYLLCGMQGMALLTEDEGRAYIDSVAYYHAPDPATEAKRAQKEEKAAKKLPKIEKRLAKQVNRIEPPDVPVPAHPDSVEGLVHVPAGSRVEVELMETVSSFLNRLGDDVWLRVREDAVVDGRVWLRAGAPVKGTVAEVKLAGAMGASGDIEIAIPSVAVANGVHVPLIGQFIDTGRDRIGASSMAAAAGGLIGLAFAPRGREAFELRGEPWHVWTRADVWVPPAEPMRDAGPDPHPSHAVSVKARFSEPLAFNLERHREIPDIRLSAETAEELAAVALVAVEGWAIPEPPSTTRLSRSDGMTTAIFDGWSLLRHLPAGSEALPVYFLVETKDGRSMRGRGEVTWDEASPE